MSFVNITYLENENTIDTCSYDVFTADFSPTGRDQALIGLLLIDLRKNTFSFEPEDSIKETFIPPEWFGQFSTMENMREAHPDHVYDSEAWSAAIHRDASGILNNNSQGNRNH